MSEHAAPPLPDASEADAPEIVHWSPRHGPFVGAPPLDLRAWPFTAAGGLALGAAAAGALAVGALAIGAVAIGRLAVGRARLKDVTIDRLEIGELVILRER